VSGQALNARRGRPAKRAGRGPERRPPRRAGRRLAAALPALAGALILLVGCSGSSTGPSPAASASPAGTGSGAASAVPDNGLLRLVVPPGPVQNGNVDSREDWVTPFEHQTGCRVELKITDTDAEAINAVNRGIGRYYYDGVLGSPEVLGTLARAGDLQPLDVQRITGYPQLSPRLRTAPSELYGGKLYGMPNSWDSYVIGYDGAAVKPAPQSWAALFRPASATRYAHKVTLPDSPVTLALAALYLESVQPSLGITDPFELTKPQLAAAQQAVIAIRPSVAAFWSQDSDVVGPLGDGQYVLGAVLNHQIEEMARAGLPTAGGPALAATAGQGPAVARVLSWMMTAKAPNSSCMYKWLSWSASPYVQERVSAFTSDAPANPSACRGAAAANCSQYRESSLPAAKNVVFEHLPVSGCGQGQTGCTTYGQWKTAWQRIAALAVPTAKASVGG
jgi:putative spermidine/putrescine transport system substrate-binding protein